MQEKVSLIIPAFNASGTIEECLRSVFESDLKNSEVIVVDDCSRDSTVEIAKGFPCIVIRNKENSGAAATRNNGARRAKGRILLFIDSDVTVQKDILRKTLATFQKYPQLSAIVGTFSKRHRHNSIISQYKNLHFYYYSTKIPFYTTGLNSAIAAIKKDAFWAVKGFDPAKKTAAEDVDLGMRLSNAGYLIFQSKDIEVEHLKKLSFKGFVKNDFDRGKAIAKSLFREIFKKRLNEKVKEGKPFSVSQFWEIYLSIPLPLLILAFTAIGFFVQSAFFAAILLLLVFIFLNAGFWSFLAKEKGIKFSVASSLITFFDMIVFSAGIASGFAEAIVGKVQQ